MNQQRMEENRYTNPLSLSLSLCASLFCLSLLGFMLHLYREKKLATSIEVGRAAGKEVPHSCSPPTSRAALHGLRLFTGAFLTLETGV